MFKYQIVSILKGHFLMLENTISKIVSKNKRIIGSILSGACSILKLAIKPVKRLHAVVTFGVQIAKDYSDAIRLALRILSTVKSLPDDSPVPVASKPLTISHNEDKICPVTGLPITSKPEWIDIDLGEGYSVTFKFIGERILLSIPRGKSGEHGMENFMRERSKVCDAMLGPEEPFFEIKDYSGIEARITRAGRVQFTKGIMAEKDRIIGFIGYNAPLVVRLSINVGKRLYNSPFPIFAVNDYEAAIKKAAEALKGKGYGKETLTHEVITSDEWSLQIDGFSARFEIIDGHIFHADTNGFLQEEHITTLFNMHEKIISSTPLPKGLSYFVGGVTDVKGSQKAYNLYFNNMMQRYKDLPFRAYIFYGAKWFLRAAINIATPFAPFPVKMAKDFNSALRLITKGKAKEIQPESLQTVGDTANKSLPPNHIQQYVKDLLGFIGNINWEIEGFDITKEIDPSHPFCPVFEAITLIKNDLDELFQERNRAEEALKKSEEQKKAILDASIDQIRLVDTDRRIIWANETSTRNLNVAPEDIAGQHCYKVFVGRDTPCPKCSTRRALNSGNIEHTILHEPHLEGKKGETYWDSYAIPIKNKSGDIENLIQISRDITDRKHAEKLEQEKIKAESANKAKNEFIANMSHEIRTPLNGIIGMAELALDSDIDEGHRNILRVIIKEANSLLGIINEILDFSKIEAGKLELEEIPFDLRYTIDDVAYSFAYRARQKGLRFIYILAPDAPTQLIGDPGRLRQILVNLAANALKFTHEGEICIKVELAEDLGDRAKIRVSVKDTGIGIPRDKQAKIFERFVQADGSTTREYGGAGLGTTISKQLVEMMGGEIGLESEEGKGSTFWFTSIFSKQKEKIPTSMGKDFDLSNLKVLVVDDNKTNRFILTEYLRSWGCLPIEATGGKEALSILMRSISSKEPFDLLLTDFKMHDMNGFDLAKEIKTAETLKGLPTIVLTSVGSKGDSKTCREIGINGYLTKPVRQDDLLNAIVSVLDPSIGQDIDILPKLVTRHTIAENIRKEIHILLAEDYPTNQQVAMRHLSRAGYQVDLAENGKQVVESCKRRHYDLILMDIQMPVMDGYEATREIRKRETHHTTTQPHNHLPIIAITSHAMKGVKERCLKAGMDDYITKPLRKKELLAMVDKWLKKIDDSRLPIVDFGIGTSKPQPTITGDSQPKEDTPMDFERAVEEFEGDKEFLMEVVDGFLDNVRAQIATIRQAISDGYAEVVIREAHSIKGAAANLCADKLSSTAFKLENIGKLGALQGCIEDLERLEKEFYRLEYYVKDKQTNYFHRTPYREVDRASQF